MYEILLETEEFCLENARRELKNFGVKFEEDDCEFSVKFDNKVDLIKFFSEVYYFFNFFIGIYDSEGEDLVGFDLDSREYKLNGEVLDSLLVNYLLDLLNIDSGRVIDPLAERGDVLIETLVRVNKVPRNVKKRHDLPFVKKFDDLNLASKPKIQLKGQGVVQDNQDFKYLKENLSYTSLKAKLSQYELEWLDVKFQRDSFDYLVTFLQDEVDVEQLLYQAEFVTKKKIGIISLFELDKKQIKANKLNVINYTVVEFDEEIYHFYVLN